MTTPARREPPAQPLHDEAALADAAAIVERAEQDERAADDARRRYQDSGIQRILVDADVLAHLDPDEQVLAMRPTSVLEDWAPTDGAGSLPTGGPLYVTTARILQLGRVFTSIDLELVDELALAGERLLLTLHDGHGFTIDVPEPRLFRVQVAAALRAARA